VPDEIFPYFLQKVKAENRGFGKKSSLKREVLDKKSDLRYREREGVGCQKSYLIL
jgi:hypothetical protein